MVRFWFRGLYQFPFVAVALLVYWHGGPTVLQTLVVFCALAWSVKRFASTAHRERKRSRATMEVCGTASLWFVCLLAAMLHGQTPLGAAVFGALMGTVTACVAILLAGVVLEDHTTRVRFAQPKTLPPA